MLYILYTKYNIANILYLGDIMYNRQKVYEYAKKWAYGRNPQYYNYDPVGGDCTNFVSQCIFAGYGQMNYNLNNGWYYINGNNKSPSWTGVKYLYNFLVNNKDIGPKGIDNTINNLEIGDIVQLSFDGINFYHSVIVVKKGSNENNTLISAHTFDAFEKSIADYGARIYRCVHIQ